MRRRRASGTIDSSTAACVATMSFGRPVLPPEVGAFHEDAIAGGSASSERPGSGSKPAGRLARPPASASSTPTTRLGSASAMIASRSARGSLAETGCGVAPTFHAAITASKNAMPFGSPIVTKESGRTPSAA